MLLRLCLVNGDGQRSSETWLHVDQHVRRDEYDESTATFIDIFISKYIHRYIQKKTDRTFFVFSSGGLTYNTWLRYPKASRMIKQ